MAQTRLGMAKIIEASHIRNNTTCSSDSGSDVDIQQSAVISQHGNVAGAAPHPARITDLEAISALMSSSMDALMGLFHRPLSAASAGQSHAMSGAGMKSGEGAAAASDLLEVIAQMYPQLVVETAKATNAQVWGEVD